MKLFLIGQSGCGKTPLATMIAKELNFPVIAASDWVKPIIADLERKPDASKEERNAFIQEATKRSIRALKEDRRSCLRVIEPKLTDNVIIEGVRNPFDFISLFDWATDFVFFLERRNNPYAKTGFESGIDVINDYVGWAFSIGLLASIRFSLFCYEIEELENIAKKIVAETRGSS